MLLVLINKKYFEILAILLVTLHNHITKATIIILNKVHEQKKKREFLLILKNSILI